MQRILNSDTGRFEYLYSFAELPSRVMDKLRQEVLEIDRDTREFSEYCKEYLFDIFGRHNDLDVTYALSYSQGDGLVIYGNISLDLAIELSQDKSSRWYKMYFSNVTDLTQLNWAVLKHTNYLVGGSIELRHKGRYCNWSNMLCEYHSDYMRDAENYAVEILQGIYDMHNQYGFDIRSQNMTHIKTLLDSNEDEVDNICATYVSNILERFGQLVIESVKAVAGDLETQGYNYFYDISDADVESYYVWQSKTGNIVFDSKGNMFDNYRNQYTVDASVQPTASKTIITPKSA